MAHNKGIGIEVEIEDAMTARMQGDPFRIRQILINLLSNAIKFTTEGQIVVTVDTVEIDNLKYRLKVQVADSGIGIAPEKIEHIFESVSQADGSTTRNFGGTGLGLSICNRLSHLMQGEIGVESFKGVGSTFWFTVTLAKTATPSHDQSVASFEKTPDSIDKKRIADSSSRTDSEMPSDALVSGHILLVEDNPTNRKFQSVMLKKLGLTFDCASDGAAAVATVQNTEAHYDVVFVDSQMPVLDGIRATELIRRKERKHGLAGQRLPIIALTANAMQGDREKYIAAGMDDYLSKPVNRATLENTLRKWLTSSQSQRHEKNNTNNNASTDSKITIDTQLGNISNINDDIDDVA